MSKLDSNKFVVEAFFELLRSKEGRQKLRFIFSFIDDLLLTEQFEIVDSILCLLDLNYLNIECMIGFLAITLPAKDKLEHRSLYYLDVKNWLELIEPDRVEGLLVGLE